MIFVLCGVLLYAYMDSDKVFTADIIKRRSKPALVQPTFDRSKVFDLKAISGVKQPPSPPTTNKTPPIKPPTPQPNHTSNGHIPNSKKLSVSSPFYYLRQIFSWLPFRSVPSNVTPPEPTLPTSDKNGPVAAPVANGGTNIKSSSDKPGAGEPVVVERPPLLLKLPNKRNKAAKRHHNDISNSLEQQERKLGTQEAGRSRRQEPATEKNSSKKNDRNLPSTTEVTNITELTLCAEETEDNSKNGESGDIFRCIALKEIFFNLAQIQMKFVPEDPVNDKSALVQVMAWHRTGSKPLSEPILPNFLRHHNDVIRTQWVNPAICICYLLKCCHII